MKSVDSKTNDMVKEVTASSEDKYTYIQFEILDDLYVEDQSKNVLTISGFLHTPNIMIQSLFIHK